MQTGIWIRPSSSHYEDRVWATSFSCPNTNLNGPLSVVSTELLLAPPKLFLSLSCKCNYQNIFSFFFLPAPTPLLSSFPPPSLRYPSPSHVTFFSLMTTQQNQDFIFFYFLTITSSTTEDFVALQILII